MTQPANLLPTVPRPLPRNSGWGRAAPALSAWKEAEEMRLMFELSRGVLSKVRKGEFAEPDCQNLLSARRCIWLGSDVGDGLMGVKGRDEICSISGKLKKLKKKVIRKTGEQRCVRVLSIIKRFHEAYTASLAEKLEG